MTRWLLLWLAMATPAAFAERCHFLNTLASGPPDQIAATLVATYRTWLASDPAKALTPPELAGLAADPFHLVDGAGGRADTRTLLAEFAEALQLVEPHARDVVVENLRAVVRDRHGIDAEKKDERSNAAPTRHGSIQPYAQVETASLHGDYLGLAGGRNFIFAGGGSGSFDVPLSRWRWGITTEGHRFFPSFDREWILEVNDVQNVSEWHPAIARTIPKSPKPLSDEILNRQQLSGGFRDWRLSSNGSKAVLLDRLYQKVYAVPAIGDAEPSTLMGQLNVVGVSNDGQSLWSSAGVTFVRTHVLSRRATPADVSIQEGSVKAFQESRDGKKLHLVGVYVNSRSPGLQLVDLDAATMKLQSQAVLPTADTIRFSPDGENLILVDPSGGNTRLYLWSIAKRKVIAEGKLAGAPRGVSITPDGRELLVAVDVPGRGRAQPKTIIRGYHLDEWLREGLILEGPR